MKKIYSFLLMVGVLALIYPSNAYGQTYTYDQTNSGLNVGNPGGVRTLSDASTSGGTIIHRYNAGPNGSTGSAYTNANYWSNAIAIPFTFKFYGATVDSFCVSKNGLLTFNTSLAGSLVNSNLNTNQSLPYSNMPDSTIAYFWENMSTTSKGTNDNVYRFTFGSSPNRQMWVQNFSYRHGSMSFSYFAVVFEEGTNNIYIVDESYYNGSHSLTAGVQLSTTSAVQVTTGLNSTAGSPNLVFGAGNSLASNNEYYIFKPKLLVTDDMTVEEIVNPSGVVCSSSDSIKIKVKNEGTNTVTDFDVVWSVNGTSQSTYSYSGSLASGASTTVNLGSYTYGTSTSTFNFDFRTDDPNGNTDKNLTNDTLKTSLNKGLSGTYTVGTSTSDYATVAAAMADLKASGVCGEVVMNIASGTYTGQVVLEGDIPGASSTNTITFKSATGNPANVTFDYSSTSTARLATFLLKKTSFIIMRDVTFESKGTSYGWQAQVWDCNNVRFSNCHFKSAYTGTSSYHNNLVINGNATSYSSGALNENITVDSCTFTKGGYAACSNYGPSTSSKSGGFVFTNNTISNAGYYGVRMYYQEAPQIIGNNITMASNGYAGVFGYYCVSSSTTPIRVNSNVIQKSDYMGIYFSSCDNPSTARGECYNNMIGNFAGSPTYYGIYNYSSDYWNIFHNSVDIRTTTTSTVRACYMNLANYTDVRNNIFSVQGSSSTSNHYAFYSTYTPSTTRVLDYNVYYNPNGTYLIRSGSNRTASVLNTYSTVGDVNSINAEPPFMSASNLRLSDACFDKVSGISAVSTDIDGDVRNPVFPHPGADEVGTASNDIGIVSIESPSGTVSSGTQTVKVIVRNYGSNSVTGYNVNYKVAGGSTVTQSVSGTLASCANDTITFTTTFSHTVGCSNISSWTSAPNSTTDGNTSNDTASSSFGVAMSGTFTVGGTSGDFSTIDAALDALNCAGVGGAVVFNIASGTYSGQFELGSYSGASATNTITFQAASGNASDVKITNGTTTSGARHTIRLNNSRYIVLRNLSIEGSNTTYAWPLHMMGADYITVSNCIIGTTTENTSGNFIGICINNSPTSWSSGYKTNSILIDSNTISKAGYGISSFGGGSSSSLLSAGLTVSNNTMTQLGYYGMVLYYQTGTVLHNNVINLSTSVEANTGIYCYYVKNNVQFTQNQIRNSGYQGVYLSNCDNTSSARGLFANNTIGSFRGNPTFYGLYNSSSDNWDYYHNTVVIDITSSSTARGFYFRSANSFNVRNNIFVINGSTNTSSHLPFYTTSSSNGSTRVLDYNVYYNQTGTYALYNGGYRTKTALNTYSSSSDNNSISVKPPFKSSSDLHLADGCFNRFPSISSVTTDMDGKTRNSTTTHPGADEVETGALDAGVTEILSPTGVVTAGNQTVQVVVKNYGSTTITALTVHYQFGTATSQSQAFSGLSIASCTVDTLTFTSPGSHTAGCVPVRSWTSLPNGMSDDVSSNDEGPSTTIGVPMAGGVFTVGTSSSDFETIQDAIDEMQCAGIGGAVTFNIASGTYTGQWSIENIPGVSSTNTITFQSATGDPSDVILTYANNAYGNFHTLRIRSTDYVNLRGITVESTNSFNGWPMHIMMSSNVNIDRCVFKTGGTLTSSSARIPMVVNTSMTSYSSGSLGNSDNLHIDSCRFENGGYGFAIAGRSSSSTLRTAGFEFTNNTLVDQGYYGARMYYLSGATIHNNTITMNPTSTYSYYPFFLGYVGSTSTQPRTTITNNVIRNTAITAVYLNQCDGASTNRTLFANNVITDFRVYTGTNSGIFNTGSDYIDFWHNTIEVNPTSSASCRAFNRSSGNYLDIRNNIFSVSGSTVSTSSYAYYSTTSPGSLITLDNNNYYNPRGTNLIYSGGNRSATVLNTYSSSGDMNSMNMNPHFSSSPVYHSNQERLYGVGDSTGTMKDIAGAARSLTMPTIGALEINPDLNVMSVTSDSACGTMNSAATVSVTFKNEGDIIQQAARFNVSVDAGTPVLVSVTGPFAQGMAYTRTLPITVDLSGTTANTITVTNADGDVDGTDNSASTSVPYWAYPVSSFTQSDSCFGDAMKFTNTSTIATGSIASTDWKFGDGNTASTTNPTNTYTSSGNFTVTIMSESNVGCRDTATQSVNVLTDLAAGTISSASTICYNTAPAAFTSTAAASGSAGTYQYQWQSSTDNTTFTDITGATNADYTSGNLTTTTYFRRAVTTDVGCGPVYTSSLKITVYDDLVAATIGSDQNICYNTVPAAMSQSVAATGGDGTWTYQWESSDNGTSWSSIAGATNTTYAPGALTSTKYYRMMSIGGSGCGSIASNAVKILVYNDLYAGLVGNDHSVCPQSPANTLNGTTSPTGGDNTYTYQWQTSTDNATWTDISGATSASLTSTTGLTVTTFYRRNTTSGSGCGTKPTNSVKITIAPLPKSSFIVANHCFNDVMPVTNNSTVATGSLTGFAWEFGDGNTSTARVPSHIYAASGFKTVKLKVTTNIGCVDSSTNVVNVSNVPTPAFSRVFDCVKEEVLFKNATSVNCGKISAFAWDFGDGSTSTAQNPSHKYSTTGTYTVKFKIFLPGGFEDSISRSVTIAKKGVSGFTADDECFGDSVRFVNSSTNAASYAWSFGDKTTSTVENPVHFYRVAQSYNATLITTDGNDCDDTTTKKVTIKVKPSVYFSTDDRCINTGKPFINGTLYAHSYAWTFGDGNTSNTSAKSQSHVYTSTGTFDVKLVAYNNNGCRDSFEDKVTSFPNPVAAFTLPNSCSGDAVNATNTSTSNLKNHWDMGDGATFTTATPKHQYNKAGTYSVALTVESVNGCKDTTRSNVTVYDTPKADFAATTVCAGNATAFTNNSTGGSGTVTHAWNFGDGSSSSAENPTHTYSAAGKYTVTLTTSGQGSCSGTSTKTVQVYDMPTASVSVSDVCVGTASHFVPTTTSTSTYAWDFGDGNSSAVQSPKHTYASAGTYTVKLTVTSINGCTADVTTTATVNDLPATGFTSSTVCLGNATVFTNTTTVSSGTLTYSWNFGDGSTSTSANPSHTYGTSGTYTVTLMATANGCSKSMSGKVVVNDVPTADFSATNECLGTATQFSNTSGGATKYSWNFGDGSTASTASSPAHTYATAGTYTVTLTAENAAGCTNSKSMSVTVYGMPTAAFSASDACAKTAVSFTNNSSAGSYLWSFGDGSVSSSTSPSHTYNSAGTYTVMLSVKNANGCESSTSSQITIHALPQTAFAAANGCEKAGIQFTNNTPGTNTYAWTFGDAGTSSAKNPNHTYASAGTYNVTLTATNGDGCSMEAKQTITISPQPTVTFNANSPCEGSAVVFTNNSTRGANSWTMGDGAQSRLLNPSHTYASAGTYSVKLTVTTAAGCENSMTSNVTVNPNPVASFTSTALCTGPNVDFTNTSSIGGGSIANSQWNYGDASTGTSNSHTYAKAGVYNVTLTVTSNRGCMTSTTSPVAVYEAPTAKFSTSDVCLGSPASFTNESSNANSVSWKFGDGNSSNLTNPTHTYASASTYTVELTAMNPLGCTNTSTGSIKVSANPTADFTAPSGCEGAATMFTNTSTGGGSSSWNFGDGTLSNQENPSHTFASSGNKNVTLIVRSGDGCSGEVTKLVAINTSPTAAFTAIGSCLGDETMFSNTTQNGTSFAWSFGDGNVSTDPNPSNTYGATGDYRVLLIASNSNCLDSTEQLVPINALPNSDFTHATSGREVTFSPVELGGTSYSWNFGDGKSSTSISPVHRYSGAVVQTFSACLTLTNKAGCTSEKCNDVNVDLVGVNDVTSESGVNVYPNPNTGAFVIAFSELHGDVEIAVYDTKGVLVTMVDTTKPSTQFNVDVTGVAEGVYFVQIKNGDYTSTQRVVITK